jgi:hypothetical protein
MFTNGTSEHPSAGTTRSRVVLLIEDELLLNDPAGVRAIGQDRPGLNVLFMSGNTGGLDLPGPLFSKLFSAAALLVEVSGWQSSD